MGRVVRFKGIKATPKSLEKDLLARADRLAEDPSVLIPQCEGKCWRCPYDKLLKKMEKVKQSRGDAETLQAIAMHGDQLVRAYAATLSLSASGKVPFLSTKMTPSGPISFAVRGKVDPERLIGVQYFDDPDLRLLAYFEDARSQKLHIYSSAGGLWCASEGPQAPQAYIEETIAQAPYDILVDGSCGHPESVSGLVINWRSADKRLFICQDCVGDVNLLHHLSARIAAPNPMDDFDVDVLYSPKCSTSASTCGCREGSPLSQDLLESYRTGKTVDQKLVEEGRSYRMEHLRTHGIGTLVLANSCYQGRLDEFVANLKGSEAERLAVDGLLRTSPVSVVSESDQAGKIITDLWPANGEALLSMVAGEDTAKKVLAMTNLTPPQMVNEARRIELASGIESRLPEYAELGEVSGLADTLARALKIEGKVAMVRALDRVRLKDHKSKAVAYGFLAAVGEAEGRNWQFTKEEIDYGIYLKTFAAMMLEANGNEYDEALRTLLTASGSSENPVRSR
ncbi:MAG: hypothetical protein ABR879_07450 [Methanomassiliicoccales archaeon]|jgi:hypothetical protein